jgi:hypothetical protein
MPIPILLDAGTHQWLTGAPRTVVYLLDALEAEYFDPVVAAPEGSIVAELAEGLGVETWTYGVTRLRGNKIKRMDTATARELQDYLMARGVELI